jgi:class 3 adenylate cyclase/TolB-like protein|tara:strand:+ start:554 stop:3058 length:2505 start_codon:yes stop_codon:yes gene_type:complete
MSKNTKKKLAAVMFCKFVDYDKYVQNDKKLAIKILSDYDSVITKNVKKFSGRLIKNINETVFAEFPSSTDAVRCAISIHYNFKKENSQNPDTYQIHGKIGIHMGEVYEKKGDLFGDGVNLAARIQPIAETDGTVCTQSVYNAIRSDNTIFLRDMGRIALKNIQDPERVFKIYKDKNEFNKETASELTEKLIEAGVDLFDRKSGKESVTPIAVSYIKNLGSSEDDFFCYGITEDLILDISKAKRMRVPKINEVIKFKDSTLDSYSIGKELNVDFLIEGNIMKVGDKFKLSMHFSNIKNSSLIWDKSWEGKANNIQSIRSEIAIKVLESIGLDIPQSLLDNLDKEDKISPEAYELFIKAKYTNFKARSTTDREISQDLFKKAIKIEPNYVEARYNYAMTMFQNNQYERAVDILDDAMLIAKKERDNSGMAGINNCYGIIYARWAKYNNALNYFEKALELRAKEDNLDEESKLLQNIGLVHSQNVQLEKALDYYNRALDIKRELDDKRGIATTLYNTSLVYRRIGDFYKAINYSIEAIDIFQELNVKMYDSILKTYLGMYRVFMGQYENAEKDIREALDICQNMNDVNSLGMCHRALGIMYLDQKKWNKSQYHFKTAMSNHKKAEHRSAYEGTIVFLATAYYYEGQYDKAKEFIDKAVLITSRRKDVSFYDTTSRAVQMLVKSKMNLCKESDIDKLAKEIIDSSSERENNRECLYISQTYLNVGNQKKADKFQKLCKSGLLKSAEKISDDNYRSDYLNTYMHKQMLNDKAVPYNTEQEVKKSKPLKVVAKTNPTLDYNSSICPQYGTYFNFCPNCSYNNTKNDFKFCPDCGTSLTKR